MVFTTLWDLTAGCLAKYVSASHLPLTPATAPSLLLFEHSEFLSWPPHSVTPLSTCRLHSFQYYCQWLPLRLLFFGLDYRVIYSDGPFFPSLSITARLSPDSTDFVFIPLPLSHLCFLFSCCCGDFFLQSCRLHQRCSCFYFILCCMSRT